MTDKLIPSMLLTTLAAIAGLAVGEEPLPVDRPLHKNVFVNQAGYLPGGTKIAVVEGLAGDGEGTFAVICADRAGRAYAGKLAQFNGDFGSYAVGDFSAWTKPGQYVIEARSPGQAPFCSYTFRIGVDVYDDAIRKGVQFHTVQRCGPSTTGYHAPCHLDDAIRADNGQYLDLVGGWHNSSDLLKWSGASLLSLHGLLNVAQLTTDAELKRRVLDEVRWGNLYFHKLQDPAGYVYTHGVGGDAPAEGNHWTDSVRGTADDRRAVTKVARLCEQHAFIWGQSLAAQVYHEADPEYASLCLDRARRCWQWVVEHQDASGYALSVPFQATVSYDRIATSYSDVGTGISAGLQMYQATKEAQYEQYAVAAAEKFLALQEREWVGDQQHVRGFFYANAERRDGQWIGIYDPLCLIAMCELIAALPDHPQATSWRQAVEMYVRDCAVFLAGRNAFGLGARTVTLSDPDKPNAWVGGAIPRNRKIGKLGYRYFAGMVGGGGNYHHAGLAVALFKAARLYKQPHWSAVAQRQLDWILGANPFHASYMIDVGHVHPPEYIYTGFLPRTPWLPGATMQGVFGDPYDRPDPLPGHFLSAEYWTVHASFLIWGLAEAKAYQAQMAVAKPR